MDKEKEGVPITAIREIKILKALNSPYIVKLKEIVVSAPSAENAMKGSIYMVMEYLDHDLTGLADTPGIKFGQDAIKCYMMQLLRGVAACHASNILHRDIKGSNLLIDKDNNLKIADFGLARPYTESHVLTNKVITLWYRPPELLLGADKYGPGVDMWSVGCIFAELIHGKPILPGKKDVEQLQLIFRLCGTPNESNWPGVTKLKNWKLFQDQEAQPGRLNEVFQKFPPKALTLISKMLELDPSKRISAKEAIDDDYFWTGDKMAKPEDLPRYEQSSHEYQAKKRKEEAKRNAANPGAAAKRARAANYMPAPTATAAAASAAPHSQPQSAVAGSYGVPPAAAAASGYRPGYAPQSAAGGYGAAPSAAAGRYAPQVAAPGAQRGAPAPYGHPPAAGPGGYPPAPYGGGRGAHPPYSAQQRGNQPPGQRGGPPPRPGPGGGYQHR